MCGAVSEVQSAASSTSMPQPSATHSCWAQEFLQRQSRKGSSLALPHQREDAPAGERGAAERNDLNDDDLDAAFAELLAKREMAVASADPEPIEFVPWVRGSAWTLATKGSVADFQGARAKGQTARDWCGAYGLEKQFTVSIVKHPQEYIHRMTNEWMRRMQHWYNEFKYSPVRPFRYTAEVLASYLEREEFAAWAETLPPRGETAKTVARLRSAAPTVAPIGGMGAASSSSSRMA